MFNQSFNLCVSFLFYSLLLRAGLLSNLYKSVDNHGTVALDSFSSENAIISYEELQAQDLRPIQELSETKRTERNALLILIVGKHALEPSSRDMAKQTLRHIRELFKTYVDPLTIGNILQNPNNRKLRSTLYVCSSLSFADRRRKKTIRLQGLLFLSFVVFEICAFAACSS